MPGSEQDLLVSAASVLPFEPGMHRLAGADRFATSVAISGRFEPGVPTVYVATGTNFPDALAAASAAAHSGGPLLLTRPDVLPTIVRDEIVRLAPARIVVAGSDAAVSADVFAELGGLAPKIDRLGGGDRFETAEKIIADAFPAATEAFVVTGRAFPDALAASAAAGRLDAPVMLVDGIAETVPDSTIALLADRGVQLVRVIGSEAAVGEHIEQQLSSSFLVVRHEGSDRFRTAVAVNDAVFGSGSSPWVAFIATGVDFADALAGAALAGGIGAPIFLTRTECMPPEVADSLLALSPAAEVVFGGTPAVSAAAAAGVECIVWVKPANGRITDGFGPRTPICTPGGCTQSFHRGTDIGTGCWSPIRAASSGRVVSAGPVGTLGNFIRLTHGGGIDTGYAHLMDGGMLVRPGETVEAGEQIGWSGATGAATGCHLHFEVYVNGSQVDPVPFLAERGVVLG